MPDPAEAPAAGTVREGLDRVPCGYLATGPDGIIRQVNATLLAWLGFAEHEVVGVKRFTDLLSGGGRIYHETHYRPTLEIHGEAHEIAVDLVTADGQRIPTLLTSVLDGPGSDAPGTVRSALFKAIERRRYEQELLLARQRSEASEAEALSIARTLQQTLIPPAPPIIGGLHLSVAFRPAGDGGLIGGDFYDVFELQSGDWVVLIGDVCGKGVDAAALAAIVRYFIRAEVVQTDRLDHVLEAVNRRLIDHGADRYCTVLLSRLSVRSSGPVVTMSLGGHPPAILRAPDGTSSSLGRPGSLVGTFPDASYHQVEQALAPGQTLVLYTDGVTEGRSEGEFFGDDRLRQLIRDGDPESLAARVVEAVLEFQGGYCSDDVAVITVTVPPA